MIVLISLKVKYGFPVEALYGFLNNRDHEIWKLYLKQFLHEISINTLDRKIYWLIKNCEDVDQLRNELCTLPLLKEEFLQAKFYEFCEFKELACLFKETANFAGTD